VPTRRRRPTRGMLDEPTNALQTKRPYELSYILRTRHKKNSKRDPGKLKTDNKKNKRGTPTALHASGAKPEVEQEARDGSTPDTQLGCLEKTWTGAIAPVRRAYYTRICRMRRVMGVEMRLGSASPSSGVLLPQCGYRVVSCRDRGVQPSRLEFAQAG